MSPEFTQFQQKQEEDTTLQKFKRIKSQKLDSYKSMTRTELQEYFDYFDIDLSGELDREEMYRLGGTIGMDPKRMEVMIKEIDTDGNGLISFDEFYTWVMKSDVDTLQKTAVLEKEKLQMAE